MQIDAVDALEFSQKTGKRAVYEAFAFRPLGEGRVEVENQSHEESHTYVVRVVSGLPSTCECPADRYHEGACKHRVTLALRPAVIEAAEAGQEKPVLADGGRMEWDEVPDYTEHVEPEEQGGEPYVRCEGCGRELLTALGGREKLMHADGCPNGEE